MISTRIKDRKDSKSSASDALRYGQGLTVDKETGEYLDKSHRTRLGNFGLIDDGVYVDRDITDMAGIIDLASVEMQSNCDLNTRVDDKSKIAHFLFSFDQYEPTEAVLRDTEDSMLSAMKLDNNHFSTFLHNDNGHWHLHIFVSRIEKDEPHRVNSLWEDKTKRDKVCREIEIRHNLKRDNGMHQITEAGLIVEIPLAERRAAREAKRESDPSISDKAKTTEIYSGEKTFQTWANEIRIGDRLKHAKSWQDLHTAAAAYNCEIKKKGNGLVICPIGEAGGIQLSKVGLKNLPAKFGAFQPAQAQPAKKVPEAAYQAGPTEPKAQSHYDKWREASDAFKPAKTDKINEQREAHKLARAGQKAEQKAELENIRARTSGQARIAAVSIAKMQNAISQAAVTAQFAHERQTLRKQLAGAGPGNTFRDYLVNEAAKGDDVALGLAQKYGVEEATDVLRKREAEQLKIVAAVHGQEYRPAPRMNFTHKVERNGSVIYDFGGGRKVTDSAIAKQVQLNAAAASSPEAVATALRFATTKFGNTLTLTGSAEFQRLAAETAVLKGLNIKFTDPNLEQYRQKFAAEQQRKPKEKNHVNDASTYRNKPARQIPPAHRRDRLHRLSDSDVVLHTDGNELPLRENVPGRVEQLRQEKPDHGMQRATAGAGRSSGSRLNAPTVAMPDLVLSKPLPPAQPQAVTAEELETAEKKASYAKTITEVHERGGKLLEVSGGMRYIGTLEITPDGRFGIQDQGRGDVVIHDLSKIEGEYRNGQKCEIRYSADGKGNATLKEPKQPGHTPGGRG